MDIDDIDIMLEKVSVSDNDVVLLRGNWEKTMVEALTSRLNSMEISTILLVLPTKELDFEVMAIGDFYSLLKHCEAKLGLSESNGGVISD